MYEVPDIPGGHQWRDPDDLVRAGKARVSKLRRPLHVTHGVIEACTESGCRICEPHTEATLTKLRTYLVKMYRLMCGREPCERDFSANKNTAHFNLLRKDEWILHMGAIPVAISLAESSSRR
eukprot:COSAG02_NODE_872_length_16321_cov_6.491062_5_plen_122_part_00